MAQVTLTVDADMQLRRRLGLRDRARRAVMDVLEAALEVRRLGTGDVHKDAPLIIRVGPCLITYTLDLEHESATIWAVEPVREAAA